MNENENERIDKWIYELIVVLIRQDEKYTGVQQTVFSLILC